MGCVECKPKDPCREVTICECPIKDLQTDCSVYVGEDLNDINVKSGTILTTVLEKISNQFKRLKEYVDKSFEVRNVGDGIPLYRGNHNVDGAKEIKTLIAGDNVTIEESFNKKEVTISVGITPPEEIEYTAGENITIVDREISSTDTVYTAGDNITIESTTNKISSKDTVYTAGEGISISNDNKISYTGESPEEVVYTATSLGDKDIYKGKTQNNFEFRGIKASEGSPIILTETETDIEIGVTPGTYERLTNVASQPFSAPFLNDDYRIRRLTTLGGTGLRVTTDGDLVTIKRIADFYEDSNIIINPGLPPNYGNDGPIYSSIDNLRTAIDTGLVTIPRGANLELRGTDTNPIVYDGNPIVGFQSVSIPQGHTASFDLSGTINSPLRVTGGGEMIVDRLDTNSLLDIEGVNLNNNNPIIGGTNSNLNINNVFIGNGTMVTTRGKVVVKNSNISTGISRGIPGPTIVAQDGARIVVETSDIGKSSIIDVGSSTGTTIEIKGNTVNTDVSGNLVEGQAPTSIKTFGNNLNSVGIKDSEEEVESFGDMTSTGVNQSLPEFENRDRAITVIGLGKLFLNTNDKTDGTYTVDYTGNK